MSPSSPDQSRQEPGVLTEEVEVLEVAAEGVWVDARRRSACGACAAQQGCGQGLLEKLFNRPGRLWVNAPGAGADQRLRPGVVLRMAIPSGAVLRASLVLYLTPLFGLLAAALAAAAAGFPDGLQAGLAVMGMMLGWLLAGWLLRWLVPVVEPVLLGVLQANTSVVHIQPLSGPG